MRVLGIEGTAWAASAAVFDTATEAFTIETDAYVPTSGGIHPREAAEHMAATLPGVIASVREAADGPIDVVAFSRGPGLGPCLRIVGTAARAIAAAEDLPLVGVNHMIAHLEIGRQLSGFDDPLCLNASGANAHLLTMQGDRYRILGETMDTGVGNAIDKFARHLGWQHPGGPKVEAAAADGTYHALPYVVKGMDFSFSGIMSAAKAAVDAGVPPADVCVGLQESIFAMLTEVTERALALTGKETVVLGGGVGQNGRLQAMLQSMCAARGARCFIPPARFLRDNAGMIAALGAQMAAAGQTISLDASAVRPRFRPDAAVVRWRSPLAATPPAPGGPIRGAEAVVEPHPAGVRKLRVPKAYRHPTLDDRLRSDRTAAEARLTQAARRAGVPTPLIRRVDPAAGELVLQHVGDRDLATDPTDVEALTAVGTHLAHLHSAGIVHGDLTTRNVRIGPERVYLIDFGLGYHSGHIEDQAMDLHIMRQSLGGTTDTPAGLFEHVSQAYAAAGEPEVLERLAQIEDRGRYQ
jgi:N6-L-threonylcarbamoyladenine synthase/protein kinase Bud32